MAKVWKAISSTLAVLLTLALVFGAGYFAGSFPDEEAEIVEPINPTEEKFDLELPAEVEKRIVTVEEVEVVLVDISQFSTYSGEYVVITGSVHRLKLQYHGNSNLKCVAKFRKTPCFQ